MSLLQQSLDVHGVSGPLGHIHRSFQVWREGKTRKTAPNSNERPRRHVFDPPFKKNKTKKNKKQKKRECIVLNCRCTRSFPLSSHLCVKITLIFTNNGGWARAPARHLTEKGGISTPNPYLVHNIHLGRSLADKRIRGAEGGRRLARNSPGEEDTREEEPTASRARAKRKRVERGDVKGVIHGGGPSTNQSAARRPRAARR